MKRMIPDFVEVPASVFKDRGVSVLESLVEYLKDSNFTYREIGRLLNRDERTIWTVHNRAKKKRGDGLG